MASSRSEPRPLPERPAQWATTLAWITFGVGSLWILTRGVRFLVVRVVPDDGLFYLVLAKNGLSGAPSTFDGEALTNGYHPLWFLASHLPATVFSGTGALVLSTLALGLLLLGAAVRVLSRTCPGPTESPGDPVVVALAVALLLPASWHLTEAFLAILVFAVFVFHLLRTDGRPERDAVLGLLGGLTVLARLDSVFLVLPALALIWLRRWNEGRADDRRRRGPGVHGPQHRRVRACAPHQRCPEELVPHPDAAGPHAAVRAGEDPAPPAAGRGLPGRAPPSGWVGRRASRRAPDRARGGDARLLRLRVLLPEGRRVHARLLALRGADGAGRRAGRGDDARPGRERHSGH